MMTPLNAGLPTIGTVPAQPLHEGNGTFGGPIKKNRVFFFGSVDALRSGVGSGFAASAISPEYASIIQQRYPNIRIQVKNADEAVQFMIDRVDYHSPQQKGFNL